MTADVLAAVLGASFFGTAAFTGTLLGSACADGIEALDGAPAPKKPPIAAIVTGGAALGAIVTQLGMTPLHLVLLAVLCASLAAIWVTDSRRGVVPDAFTLVPLLAAAACAVWEHHWWLPISACIIFIPFAAAAALSRGRGMGWGDVKLVALGGAVLGAQLAIPAIALACLAAGGINILRGRRREAVALAPYLTAAIAIALPLTAWR